MRAALKRFGSFVVLVLAGGLDVAAPPPECGSPTLPFRQRTLQPQDYASLRARSPFDPNSPNFFALGGILVNSEDEQEIRSAHATLCDCDSRIKSSPMAPLADLLLWPVAISRYRPNRACDEFRKHCLLVDDWLQPHEYEERGTKYSCFGLVNGKATA